MTATVPPSLHDESPPKAQRDSSFFARSLEWFWSADALRRAKQALPLRSERAKRLAARARNRAEIAQYVLRFDVRAEDQTQATANELYRNAVYAALLALSANAAEEEGARYSAAVWDTLDEVLAQLGYSKPVSQALKSSLHEGSLLYFAELPEKWQVAIGSELSLLADALIQRAELSERGSTAVYVRRVWHTAALFTLLFVVIFGGLRIYRARADLAAGKPWRASSTLAGSSLCSSPAQECDQLLGAFFHTAEESNPWLEIDLGAPHSVSKVEVENRSDCCADRAHPIVIEVSTDQEHWRTAARRDEEFATWNAEFPALTARWVRVRLLRNTYLHLQRVRVF